MNDVAVIVNKDRLHIGVQAQLLHALELIGAGELHMHYAAADICVGVEFRGVFVGVQHPVEDAVADGMDGGGHIPAAGQGDHVVELLLGEDGDALFPGRVCVGLGQIGRPCAEGAVAQHLQRADPEQFAAHARGVAHIQEGLQLLHIGELALLIHADGQTALLLHLLEGREDVAPVHVFKAAEIIGLAGGHAHAVQGLAGRADHALHVVAGGLGQPGLHQHHRRVAEYAGEATVCIHVNRAALGDRGACIKVQQLQGAGVHRQAVAAAAGDADGPVGRNRVQVVTGGDVPGRGEVILIPAPAQQPALGVLRREGTQSILQRCQRSGGRAGQVAHLHGVAVVEQVHVAVIEAGADKAALQGDDGVPLLAQGKDLRVRTHGEEAAVLHDKGLCKGQRAGEDLAAGVDRSHW